MKFADYPFPSKYDNPFAHQVETVKFLLGNKRAFLLSTMGTGKTLSSAWAADFLMVNKKINKVLIIGPLSTLIPVWSQELFESFPHRRAVVLIGNKSKRRQILERDADFFIINHDGIKVIEQDIINAGFDLVIIDELTAYKTASADRSKCMKRIADKIPAVWGLTGSPTANDPTEAYGQAKVVNPGNPLLPKYFGQFRDSVMDKDPYIEYAFTPKPGWEFKVQAILSPSIRHELRDCVDLPPTLFEDREIAMSAEQKAAYKSMVKDYKADHKNHVITAVNAGVKYLKLLQISSGSVYDDEHRPVRLNCSAKQNEVINIFNEGGRRPVLVFVTFKESMKALVEKTSKKFRVEHINGDTPARRRGDIVKSFQDGEIDFLFLQPKVASHGLTLTAASTIIWYTPYPSNEVYQQANARIVRPGQTRTQLIVRLYSSPTERRLYTALDNKEKLSKVLTELVKSILI